MLIFFYFNFSSTNQPTSQVGYPDEEPSDDFNLEQVRGPLREWIVGDRPRREIARKFTDFLRRRVNKDGRSVYAERIHNMCTAQRRSLEVSYGHLSADMPVLAVWLADCPAEMLKVFDEVALRETLLAFPNYDKIHAEIKVRITDVPVGDSIRDIRQIHLNGLIRVKGVITRRTGVYPQLKAVKYDCVKCGAVLGPFAQTAAREIKVYNIYICLKQLNLKRLSIDLY